MRANIEAEIVHRKPRGELRARVAVIDNYDSFTFNLVQYLLMLGAEVWIFPAGIESLAPLRALAVDYWIVSPGPGRPEDAGICPKLWAEALEGRSPPVLGVCLGHQGLCLAAGATVRRADRVMHGKSSLVQHRGQRLFSTLPNPTKVARYHSLLVDFQSVPAELEVDAWVVAESTDRSGGLPGPTSSPAAKQPELMGVSHRNLPLYGVQFHPESIATPLGMTMMANFLGLTWDFASQGSPFAAHGSTAAAVPSGPGDLLRRDRVMGSWWDNA